ncbi:hypothetical protein SAMN05892883_2652 [Jatrophihabitans sp. GAS493]|nr:hypothetical protein SAMN05892883_2652 [Jatrophihabitans sp. GAS493]
MTEQPTELSPTRSPAHRLAAAFVPLLVLATLSLIGWRILDGIQSHSYNSSGAAPDSVELIQGETYVLSAAGGVAGLAERGITLTTQCQIVSGGRVQPLTVTPYTADSRTVNAIATFRSPVSGAARLLCTGISPVWVDDSQDSPPDYAGLLLVAGIAFGLAAIVIRLYFGYAAGASGDGDDQGAGTGNGSDALNSSGGDDQQVEAAVGVRVAEEIRGGAGGGSDRAADAGVHPDDEVTGADGGDVSR